MGLLVMRKKPPASARRQRAAAVVVENVEHVDHVVNEVHEEPLEPIMDHERTELKLACHGRKTDDKGLLSTFAERWHKKTSSFYLLIRELTITLNDMASLLHLPITGAFHTFDAIDVEEGSDLLVELLKVNRQEANDETEQCRGTYGRLAWLQNIYRSKCDTRQWTSWIYEHFPTLAPLLLMRITMRGNHVQIKWGSSIVRHQLERVVRKFGYVQAIPPLLTASSSSIEEVGKPPRHPLVVHEDTFIVPNPPILLVHSTAMPGPLAPAVANADIP
ncbi:hypothetical protein HKD37_09G024772 [Glycine soja]